MVRSISGDKDGNAALDIEIYLIQILNFQDVVM